MRIGENKKALDPQVARGLYCAAVGSALAAGAFILVVVSVLVANYLRDRVATPLDNPRLAEMKASLAENRKDEKLKADIRALDYTLRAEHFRRQDLGERAGWLLVVGGTLFVLGLKSAVTLRRKQPHPSAGSAVLGAEARLAAVARWSVAVVAVLLAAGAGLVAMRGGPEPIQAVDQEDSWPTPEEVAQNWPSFRGPGGLGVSAYTNVPAAWNGKTGDGILWKTPVPLPGENSPIVWGNRVFLTGADRKKREVYCFDADSGALLWAAPVEGIPGSPPLTPKVPEETGYACPTAVTDGRRVYALFANGDIAAFDYQGKRVSARNLGIPQSTYGYASSLAMYRNRVLVLWDQTPVEEGKSRLLALNSLTGRTAWEARRPVRDSWASPIVTTVAGHEQIVTIADPWAIAYDPATGRERWRAKVMGGDIAPSPVAAAGMVFAIQPYSKLVAIRADGAGDVTKTHVAWKAEDNVPDICSPLATDAFAMALTTQGVLTCFDVKDGKKLWEHDFEIECFASPSLVGDRVYVLSGEGTTILVAAAREFKELGRAELGEHANASPAFMDGRIYIRGKKHLFAIGQK